MIRSGISITVERLLLDVRYVLSLSPLLHQADRGICTSVQLVALLGSAMQQRGCQRPDLLGAVTFVEICTADRV